MIFYLNAPDYLALERTDVPLFVNHYALFGVPLASFSSKLSDQLKPPRPSERKSTAVAVSCRKWRTLSRSELMIGLGRSTTEPRSWTG